MPLTAEGEKVLSRMRKQYGSKAEQIFYATAAKRGRGSKWHATKGIKGQSSRAKGSGKVRKG